MAALLVPLGFTSSMNSPSFSSVPLDTGAHCAWHAGSRASIICSRCGSYACDACRRNYGTGGAELCERCFLTVPQKAEVGSRFVANLVDSFVWLAPMLLLFFGAGAPDAMGVLLAVSVLGMLGILGYQCHLANESGQSIGKRMMNIRVVRSDGSPASLGRIILLRNVVPHAIGSLCGIFGLVDACLIFGQERRCLHDLIADTIVVNTTPGQR